MLIKADGTVSGAITSFEELDRLKALVPSIVVRDLNGKMIPGIQELNTDTMDAVMFIRVEDNFFLTARVPFTSRVEVVKARVCLEGCSIFRRVLNTESESLEATEILLDKDLREVKEQTKGL